MENFRIPIVKAELTGDDFERIYEHVDSLSENISKLEIENEKQLKFIQKIFKMADITQKDIDTLLGDLDYDVYISFDHVSQKMKIYLQTKIM